MKKIVVILLLILSTGSLYSQKTSGGDIGFGLILGDPTAVTFKYFMNNVNAVDAFMGASYFGAFTIGADYLWHFNAFKSRQFFLYAGPGAVIGIGRGSGFIVKNKKGSFYYRSGVGLGVRGIIGVSFVPKNSPFEIFLEMGPMIGLVSDFGVSFDSGLGFRFYP